MLKILFVGGGSIGHIAPAVAVWEACQHMRPDLTAHFVCSPRPDDAKFLQDRHLPFSILNAPRVGIFFPIKLIGAIVRAKRILDDVQPDIIFSKGSYVSLPLCIAAKKKKIPIVLHDSDAVPGRANRIVSRWAAHICTGFPRFSTFQHFNISTFTGNPLRRGITGGSKEQALRITGLKGDRPILLVMGGSQGAVAINNAIMKQLEDLLLRCDIIHITGRGKSLPIDNRQSTIDNYFQIEFANEELAHFYKACNMAISRAGANAITELAANGIPTILVPLRGVGHDHQYKNTLVAMQYGCVHLEQCDLENKLLPMVHGLITDTKKLQTMRQKIEELRTSDAAIQISEIILRTLDSHRRDQ